MCDVYVYARVCGSVKSLVTVECKYFMKGMKRLTKT